MTSDLLVLAKHAHPEVDPSVPAAAWPLGADGRAGAARLGDRLRALAPARVVTSVEPKAAETGRVVAEVLDVPWRTGDGLHEHVRPAVGYLGAPEFEAAIRRFFSTPSQVVFGDETADDAFTRFDGAVEAALAAHPGERLCVVAHGTVISLLLSRRYGADASTTWRALGTPSYVVVDRRAGTVTDLVASV